ncbi:hypothetical protein OPV22_035101 [Ensete ventricosum]|uniref:Uncharacterized protein n=1 Tax=Ensete ventricosum TaxID=4639 RepID=A0AAX5NBH8_ENSVE|nr:hypothetical protein OPV22_035101 [Ensete ventricosum]
MVPLTKNIEQDSGAIYFYKYCGLHQLLDRVYSNFQARCPQAAPAPFFLLRDEILKVKSSCQIPLFIFISFL